MGEIVHVTIDSLDSHVLQFCGQPVQLVVTGELNQIKTLNIKFRQHLKQNLDFDFYFGLCYL